MTEFNIRSSCRLCGGPLNPELVLGETPLANELLDSAEAARAQDRFPLYLATCGHCGHVQLPVVVNPERLFGHYVYQSGTAPSFVSHLAALAETVPCSGRVVEIGSNDGSLLLEYKKQGARVLGIDPAGNIANIAEAHGVPTVREFFSRKTLGNWNLVGQKADLILALNVFAHADDLSSIAACVESLLAEDGTFVFEVGYLPTMLDRRIYRTIYHEHLSYHHLMPLMQFFEQHGLRLYDAELVPTQGGSVRGYASKRSQKEARPLTTRLCDLLCDETSDRIHPGVLRERILADTARIGVKLARLRIANARVCGYGAPAQLATTWHALNLLPKDIAYICDDNSLKQGRYTPGDGVPIVPPANLYGSDACVIFSANFADEIKARHAGYRGEWIEI